MAHEVTNVTTGSRFWSRVSKNGSCWIWRGGRSSGYGAFKLNGRRESSHRVAYKLSFGQIPSKACVLHSCDNRLCVNPQHLFLGTLADNVRDMVRKGRHRWGVGRNHGTKTHPERIPTGERNGVAKLKASTAISVRERHEAGEDCASIARSLGVSYNAVHSIVRRKTWKHLDEAHRR